MCLAGRGAVDRGTLCARVCELEACRWYSHTGGDGRKRKRVAGGLSRGPQEKVELLGSRRMGIGWEVWMRGLGEREGDGGCRWSSVALAPAMGDVQAMFALGWRETQEDLRPSG